VCTGFWWGNLRERDQTLGRPKCRREDNIKIDLQEVECEVMDWIELAQNRYSWRTLVNAVMNIWVPQNVWNFSTSCKPVRFSEGL
jgi:hypothetical protein